MKLGATVGTTGHTVTVGDGTEVFFNEVLQKS